MKTAVNMTFKKSTKGTHVYENLDVNASVAGVYIKRTGLPNTPPKEITLTIECEDE